MDEKERAHILHGIAPNSILGPNESTPQAKKATKKKKKNFEITITTSSQPGDNEDTVTQQMEQMFKEQQRQDEKTKKKLGHEGGAATEGDEHDFKEETKENPPNYKIKRTKIGIEISNLDETMHASDNKLNMTDVAQLQSSQGSNSTHKKQHPRKHGKGTSSTSSINNKEAPGAERVEAEGSINEDSVGENAQASPKLSKKAAKK